MNKTLVEVGNVLLAINYSAVLLPAIQSEYSANVEYCSKQQIIISKPHNLNPNGIIVLDRF